MAFISVDLLRKVSFEFIFLINPHVTRYDILIAGIFFKDFLRFFYFLFQLQNSYVLESLIRMTIRRTSTKRSTRRKLTKMKISSIPCSPSPPKITMNVSNRLNLIYTLVVVYDGF